MQTLGQDCSFMTVLVQLVVGLIRLESRLSVIMWTRYSKKIFSQYSKIANDINDIDVPLPLSFIILTVIITDTTYSLALLPLSSPTNKRTPPAHAQPQNHTKPECPISDEARPDAQCHNPYLAGKLHPPLTLFAGRFSGRHALPPAGILRMKRCKRADCNDREQLEAVDIEDLNFSAKEISDVRASLLEWYDENKRDLPWRRISTGGENETEDRERKAYAVWVSEMMLQQTRVQTVIDYYTRWVERWPTIYHLAQASIEEVNEMWAGLGYYRRAKFLLEGAKMIVEGGADFPKTASSLHKVKGIGKYTAGAIASIAFAEAVPVVDGNVIRVITRLKAISENPKKSTTVKNIWRLAEQLVDPLRPGDFNQAIMELGATLCSVAAPNCSTCPVSRHCQALSLSMKHESIQVADYPLKVAKAKPRHDFCAVCVVEIVEQESQSDSRYLLVKRPDEGLLAGLWEFPLVLIDSEAELPLRRKAMDTFLKQSFGLDIGVSCRTVSRDEVGVYVHVFSHIRLKMYVELLVLHLADGMDLLQKGQEQGNMIWKSVDSKALSTLGLTSSVRKVYTMIEEFKQRISDSNQVKTSKKKGRKLSQATLSGFLQKSLPDKEKL